MEFFIILSSQGLCSTTEWTLQLKSLSKPWKATSDLMMKFMLICWRICANWLKKDTRNQVYLSKMPKSVYLEFAKKWRSETLISKSTCTTKLLLFYPKKTSRNTFLWLFSRRSNKQATTTKTTKAQIITISKNKVVIKTIEPTIIHKDQLIRIKKATIIMFKRTIILITVITINTSKKRKYNNSSYKLKFQLNKLLQMIPENHYSSTETRLEKILIEIDR